MLEYKKISMHDLVTNDIFFLELDENNEPYEPYYVLRHQELIGLLCLNIRSNEILTIEFQDEEVYYFENMVNLFNNAKDGMFSKYRWLGFEYGKHKVLIDLDDLTIEKYDYENDDWYEMPSEFIQVEDNDFLVIQVEEKIYFKVNLNSLTMQVSNTKHYFKYKPFYNFLLGKENDYVFDINNDLTLSSM